MVPETDFTAADLSTHTSEPFLVITTPLMSAIKGETRGLSEIGVGGNDLLSAASLSRWLFRRMEY